jgi:hypothetical protein
MKNSATISPPIPNTAQGDGSSSAVAVAAKNAIEDAPPSGSYRARAFAAYPPICTYCGFGIPEILEVAHLDQNRKNNSIENLAILCGNCHKMHDIGLIPTEVIKTMRGLEKKVNWKLRIKDAGKKAAQTKLKNAKTARRSAAATKAHTSRKSATLANSGGV